MEKRKAHYDLPVLIGAVRRRGVASFTKTALDGGRRMGLTTEEMIEAVCGLNPSCF